MSTPNTTHHALHDNRPFSDRVIEWMDRSRFITAEIDLTALLNKVPVLTLDIICDDGTTRDLIMSSDHPVYDALIALRDFADGQSSVTVPTVIDHPDRSYGQLTVELDRTTVPVTDMHLTYDPDEK